MNSIASDTMDSISSAVPSDDVADSANSSSHKYHQRHEELVHMRLE